MLLDVNGRVIGGRGRRDDGSLDGFQLSSGAIVSAAMSKALHAKIASNTDLKERLIKAQRQSNDMLAEKAGGAAPAKPRELLHLAMLRSDGEGPSTDAIERNMAFGEVVAEAARRNPV
jgi:hypothetical protein